MFSRPDGVGLRPDFVYYQFQKLIRESGVRRIRLHDLRHTQATWLLDAGEQIPPARLEIHPWALLCVPCAADR
ncbi:MAG: TraR/DksA C4-type zinc finger protein [Candidatus Nanopelagicales bacterium]